MRFARHARASDGGGGGRTLASDAVARAAVRLVVVARVDDRVELARFVGLPELLRAGDLLVVNDAATLPASLAGVDARGRVFELRLVAPVAGRTLDGIVLGAGDHRMRTEHRPPPPELAIGDRVRLGAISATVAARDGRRITLACEPGGEIDALWQALYAHGRPVQYAHRRAPFALWDVQTGYAARPWAVEMPSAGRALTWDVLLALRRAGVAIATLTHAAGLSSTGDLALDRTLPWPERYELPARTAELVGATRARGGRVIAVGTSVVRALEDSGGVAGTDVAQLRLDPAYTPRVVDGVISGLHAPGESHFALLCAFAPEPRLSRALELAAAQGLSTHELGDACLIV